MNWLGCSGSQAWRPGILASQEDTVDLVSRPRFKVATSFVLIGQKRGRDMDMRLRRGMAFWSCDLET